VTGLLMALLAACPSCKEGLSGADQWAQGFNTSILFMMAMPFAVVGVVTIAVVRARRGRRDAGEPPAVP
jgi:heme/copper-type cytochrome/quinol oxidase subunit 2